MTILDPTKIPFGQTKGLLNALRSLYTWDGTTLALQATAITDSAGTSLVNVAQVVDSVTLGSSLTTITHTFASGYDYWLEIEGMVPQTDATVPYVRLNTDTGSNYAYTDASHSQSGSTIPHSGGLDTSLVLLRAGGTIGTGTGETGGATIRLRDFSGAKYKIMEYASGVFTSAAVAFTSSGVAVWKSTAAVTTIEIGCTGATPHFSAGTATLYRTARS